MIFKKKTINLISVSGTERFFFLVFCIKLNVFILKRTKKYIIENEYTSYCIDHENIMLL